MGHHGRSFHSSKLLSHLGFTLPLAAYTVGLLTGKKTRVETRNIIDWK